MTRFLAVSKITQQNQITLPKDVRELLKTKPNDRILFVENGKGEIYIKKQ